MKKILSLSIIALSMNAAIADDHQKDKMWVGGYVEALVVDEDNPVAGEGLGLGIELGYRLYEHWGIRADAARLELDGNNGFSDISAHRYGLDALYFANDDQFYLFTGLKRQNYTDEVVANFGIGKHWGEGKWRVVTEAVTYRDWDNKLNDFGLKVGLNYFWAEATSKPATAKDSDNDGVLDSRDVCPNSKAGAKVDSNGCEIVAKAKKPEQPVVAETVEESQLSDKAAEQIMAGKTESIKLNVLFDNDSSIVKNKDSQELVDFAAFMKRHPAINAEIQGHASSPGDDKYNLWLSQRRANSVKAVLVDLFGISSDRIIAKGYGETMLLDTSDTEQAHRINRRITSELTAVLK